MRYGKNLLAVIAAVAMLLFGGSALAAGKTLTLPQALRIIEEEAFYGDMSIGKVVLPEGTTEIRARAFAGSALEEINLPSALSIIADDAFDGCSNLVVTAEEGSYAYEWAVGRGLINPSAETPVPAGLSYEIANNQVTIAHYSGSATEIAIPETIEGYPVTSIGYGAFEECISLTNITLPDRLTSIGNHAFEYCRSLTNITIPDGVNSIGSGAFDSCSSLTTITLPDSVTSIGRSAFLHCFNLTSINIPSGVTSIGENAFGDCNKITLYVYMDSVGLRYAQSEGIPYQISYKYNDTDSMVTWIQTALRALGFYSERYTISGYFGSHTEDAVKEFQRSKGLAADGVVGPKTLEALRNDYNGGGSGDDTPVEVGKTVYNLDWFTAKNNGVFSKIGLVRNGRAKLTDLRTGKSLNIHIQSTGNHADVEPLTAADTSTFCSIYGVSIANEDTITYKRRPMLLTTSTGHQFVCSIYGTPHGDESIYDNNFPGQFCLHFLNARTHGSNSVNADHQKAIEEAIRLVEGKGATVVTLSTM